jgi:hypothetical protein
MSSKGRAQEDLEQTAPDQESAAAESEPAGHEANKEEADVIQLPAGSLAYTLVRRLRALPYDKQREVLEFAEFLAHKQAPKRPGRNVEGLWADLDIHITAEDIDEARREMWGNFPREFPVSESDSCSCRQDLLPGENDA